MRRGAVVTLTALVTVASVAAASPTQEIPRARAQFEHGDYQRVIDTLTPLLHPVVLIRDQDQLMEAHYLLGSAHFYLDHRDLARQEFSSLLFLDPQKELDPVTESPELYAFFDGLKRELRSKLEEIREEKLREDALKNRPSREIVIERTLHDPAFWPNFVPFGYPQFRNGQKLKGYLFLTSESVLGGASLALFLAQAFQYGLPSHNVPPGDASGLRTRQVLQVGTGGVAIILYLWSMADGFANQKPRTEETRTERPLTAPVVPPVPAEKPKSSFLIVPLLGPDTVGMAASWSF